MPAQLTSLVVYVCNNYYNHINDTKLMLPKPKVQVCICEYVFAYKSAYIEAGHLYRYVNLRRRLTPVGASIAVNQTLK